MGAREAVVQLLAGRPGLKAAFWRPSVALASLTSLCFHTHTECSLTNDSLGDDNQNSLHPSEASRIGSSGLDTQKNRFIGQGGGRAWGLRLRAFHTVPATSVPAGAGARETTDDVEGAFDAAEVQQGGGEPVASSVASSAEPVPINVALPSLPGHPVKQPLVANPPQQQVSLEAVKMFERTWATLAAKYGGFDSLTVPREIVWLNGAPGSGKGANTPFILKTRGLHAKAICISSLLEKDAAAKEKMSAGSLIQDTDVLYLLLDAILNLGRTETENGQEGEVIAGAVVDGFPRTTLQVDLVKLLYDKLMDLHYRHLDTPLENHFPRPIFRIAVLYVEEEESVRRQLARGRSAIAHNQRVRESGVGSFKEVRPTDLDERFARRRYAIFKEHYDTLLRLKSFFPFHLIDAMGTLSECREQIAEELQYQSGLELGEATFHAISHIPLAKNVVKQARQNMVTRLDSYRKHDWATFKQVIDMIDREVIPVVKRCALAGMAVFNTENPLFFHSPEAAEMLADILSERGYYVTWQMRTREIPVRLDSKTYAIECMRRVSLQFRIKFERPLIRNPALDTPSKDDKDHQ